MISRDPLSAASSASAPESLLPERSSSVSGRRTGKADMLPAAMRTSFRIPSSRTAEQATDILESVRAALDPRL